MQLTSFGEMLMDLLPTTQGALLPVAGGAPANVAVGFAKLGGKAAFIGGFAEDAFAHQLKTTLQSYDVNTSWCVTVPGTKTALAIVQLDEQGERSFSFYRDNTADVALDYAQLKQLQWPTAGIFHFCSNTLTSEKAFATTQALVAAAAKHQQLVSFDVNLRLNLWPNLSLVSQRVEACFALLDIIKLSVEELDYLAGAQGVTPDDYSAWLLQQGIQVIVLSDGPKPSRIITHNDYISLAPPQIQAVDTTGAGDSLISALLFYLSHSGIDKKRLSQHPAVLRQALAFALHCGAYTCLDKGVMPQLPTLAALQQQFPSFDPNLGK